MNNTRLLTVLLLMILLVGTGCNAGNVDTPEQVHDPMGKQEEVADDVIIRYAAAIRDRDAKELVKLYGGDYDWLSGFSEEGVRDDKEQVFKNYLNAVLPVSIELSEIVEKEVISDQAYRYTLTFKNADGTQFEVREAENSNHLFQYTVQMMDDQYKVMEPPPYQP